MEPKKINISEYLKIKNLRVKQAETYGHLKKNSVKKLNCKELAKLCNVTAATISNINTYSKFNLLYKIAGEIYNAYYSYFLYDEEINKKEYPDENITPRDTYYVIYELVELYSDY